MAEIIAAAAEEEPKSQAPEAIVGAASGGDRRGKGQAVRTQAEIDAAAAVAAAKAEAAAAKKEPESIAGRIVSSFYTAWERGLTAQPQGLKAIHPLLKQAKTFETQRLIKKVRWARCVIPASFVPVR
jgi:hypothetical protein